MILARRPCKIYDVDAVGVAALLGLALCAWLLVIAPWQRMWGEYQALVLAHNRAENTLSREALELQRAQERLSRLEQLADASSTVLPAASAAPRLLEEVASLARSNGLELRSMVPRATELRGPHLTQDIDLEGRGTSKVFVAFLEQLAAANPCQSLEGCTIKRGVIESRPECALSWTLRMYLRPEAGPPPAPEQATGGSS